MESETPKVVTGEELEQLRKRNLEKEKMDFERLKLQADSIKHITTLATGTIVILATFMDKMPKPLMATGTLTTAVVSLLTCIFAGFLYLWATTLVAIHQTRHQNYRNRRKTYRFLKWLPKIRRMKVEAVLINAVYFAFTFGIGELGVFVVRNIGHLK